MKLEGLVKCILFSNFCVFRTDENDVDFSFYVTFTKRARRVNRCDIFTIALFVCP